MPVLPPPTARRQGQGRAVTEAYARHGIDSMHALFR